jgi:hypothetical protein
VAYGRYWGALERVDCLHFEACYYQPLQWCIAHGVRRFEGGAQGEHKMARALLPVRTHSAHWLAHPAFADAVAALSRGGDRAALQPCRIDEDSSRQSHRLLAAHLQQEAVGAARSAAESGLFRASAAPCAAASPSSASIRPWLSTMPVDGESRAADAARCEFQRPRLGAGQRLQVGDAVLRRPTFQRGEFLLLIRRGGDDQLAAAAMGDMPCRAEFVEQAVACHAQASLERAGG